MSDVASQALSAFRENRTAEAERLSCAWLDHARDTGDSADEVAAMAMLARIAVRQRDLNSAHRLASQADQIAYEHADVCNRLETVHILAAVAGMAGQVAEARRGFTASIQLRRELANPASVAHEICNLGQLELWDEHPEEAWGLFEQARATVLGDGRSDAALLDVVSLGYAACLAHQGRHFDSAQLLGAIEAHTSERGHVLDPDDAEVFKNVHRAVVAGLGPEGAADGMDHGARTPIDVLLNRVVL